MVQCLASEIVQRDNACDHRGQRARDGDFSGVGDVRFSIGHVVVDLGVESRLHLPGRAAEFEAAPARRHDDVVEPVAL